MVKPFWFASSTVLVSSIIVGFSDHSYDCSNFMGTGALYPIAMWGSLGEGDGQESLK
jgi:hypothetical protein